MTRYFFHVFNGTKLTEDPEGEEFVDRAAAEDAAQASARELIADGVLAGEEAQYADYSYEVCDLGGELIFRYEFANAASIGIRP